MKEELRQRYLKIRKGISLERKQEARGAVYKKLLEMTQGAKEILSYSPLEDEVCVDLFNQYLAEQNRLFLPRIEGKTLVPYKVTDMGSQLKTFSHRFLEPIIECEKKETVDLVIVPGIVFDNKCGRVGFGKGFYDKFLFKTKTPSIGVLFREQLFDGTLVLEDHDVPMERLCII